MAFSWLDPSCMNLKWRLEIQTALQMCIRDRTIESCADCIKGDFADQVRTNFRALVWQPGFREDWIRNAEDFREELSSIAASVEKLGLVNWSWVHTEFIDRLDPIPEWLSLIHI